MINKIHNILYVSDQQASTDFYSRLLQKQPDLNVPGMTEFYLSENCVLGLMPYTGIEKILGSKSQVLRGNSGSVKSEIYIVVDELKSIYERAKTLDVCILNDLAERDWGHRAFYFSDKDGNLIAFAEIINL